MNTALSPLLHESFSLKDRLVVVTGPADGANRECARAILEAGGRVVLADQDLNRARASSGVLSDPSVSAAYLDTMRRDSCREFLASTIAKFGRIDVLINGPDEVRTSARPFDPSVVEDWQAELAVGMRGALSASLVIGAYMAETGGGTIVNVLSETNPAPDSLDAESLILMTRYLSHYFQDDGVRVNAVYEGSRPRGVGDRFAEPLGGMALLSRIVRREEIRAALVFLASSASQHLHGKTLVAEGTQDRKHWPARSLDWTAGLPQNQADSV